MFKIITKIVFILAVSFSQNAFALNFGSIYTAVGKAFEKLNPFVETPQSRADDFYKNAEVKVFDCIYGNRTWVKLTDGYLINKGIVFAEVKKLSEHGSLLVNNKITDSRFVCNVVGEDWSSGDFQLLTPCMVGNKPVLLCKATK
jgi:hypothetical protein